MKSNGRLFMHSHARKPHKLFHKRKHEAPQAGFRKSSGGLLEARPSAAEVWEFLEVHKRRVLWLSHPPLRETYRDGKWKRGVAPELLRDSLAGIEDERTPFEHRV